MVLTVKERIVLLHLLPATGDFTTLRIIRKLREALSFSEEEHAALKFETDAATKQVRWNVAGEQEPKDIEIGPKASAVIAERLQELDGKKQLSMDLLDLYERFCVEEGS